MYGKEEGRQKMKKDYDEIRIEDLEVFANHGVFPEENVLGQKFLVSAVLYTDTRRAGLTDDLSASIHYGEVSAFIDRYLREHTFQLLERAAEALAEELLLHTAGLEKIRLEIKKPWAPVRLPLKTVIHRFSAGRLAARNDYERARSKRSRFMTLSQAATKSRRNFSWLSAQA